MSTCSGDLVLLLSYTQLNNTQVRDSRDPRDPRDWIWLNPYNTAHSSLRPRALLTNLPPPLIDSGGDTDNNTVKRRVNRWELLDRLCDHIGISSVNSPSPVRPYVRWKALVERCWAAPSASTTIATTIFVNMLVVKRPPNERC